MGRAPCCEKEGLRRGAWSAEEDQRLVAYIQQNGHPNWRALPRQAGLLRCGKSCRLRWINYLRPDIKRGNFSADEEALIVRLHRELGNRWSAIAAQLPGRTDNEIKNVWHTHIKKRLEDAGDGDGEDKKKARKSKPAAAKRSARKKAADAGAGTVDNSSDQQQPFLTGSPGLSSSVSSGVTFSTATDSSAAAVSSADNAATTSSHHPQEEQQQQQQVVGASIKAEEEIMEMETSFSSAELEFPPIIDDSFWSSADVMDMGLGAMDEELGLALADPLPSPSTKDGDMVEFWHKMLMQAGDMTDLSVL